MISTHVVTNRRPTAEPCARSIALAENRKRCPSGGAGYGIHPRHRGEFMPTVPSRIGAPEVDLVSQKLFRPDFFTPIRSKSPIGYPSQFLEDLYKD